MLKSRLFENFRLFILISFLIHTQASGLSLTKDVANIINKIQGCHIHFVYDTIELEIPISVNPITIRNLRILNQFHQGRQELRYFPTVPRNKMLIDMSQSKTIFCVYHLIYFEKEVLNNPKKNIYPVHTAIEEAKQFFFYKINDVTAFSKTQTIQKRPAMRNYFLYFSQEEKWSLIHDSIFSMLCERDFSPHRFAIRLFNKAKSTINAAYFCYNCLPITIIPMPSENQVTAVKFESFAASYNYKIVLVYLTSYDKENKQKTEKYQKQIVSKRIFGSIINSKILFQKFIANEIISLRNMTWVQEDYIYKRTEYSYCYNQNLPTIHTDVVSTDGQGNAVTQDKLQLHHAVVATKNQAFNFFTCYTKPSLSFLFYFEPFQLSLWLSIFAAALTLATVSHLYLKFKKLLKTCSFSSYLMMFASLVEQSCVIPPFLEALLVFRITWGFWLLLNIIFTNAYKGIVSTEVVAPVKQISIEKFADLIDSRYKGDRSYKSEYVWFTGLVDLLQFIPEVSDYSSRWNPKKDFKLFSPPIYPSCGYPMQLVSNCYDVSNQGARAISGIHRRYNSSNEKLFQSELTLLDLFNHQLSVFTPRKFDRELDSKAKKNPGMIEMLSAIEEEILQCDKTAYVNGYHETKLEYEYISNHYHWLQFTLGKEYILQSNVGWNFEQEGSSGIANDLKIYIQSGIYHKLEDYFILMQYHLRLNYTLKHVEGIRELVKPAKLVGNIQTIFFLYLLGIGVTAFAISKELRLPVRIYRVLKNIGSKWCILFSAFFIRFVQVIRQNVLRC